MGLGRIISEADLNALDSGDVAVEGSADMT